MMAQSPAQNYFRAAQEKLSIVKTAASQFRATDAGLKRAAIMNAVVYGRMVTFALQNCRGKVSGFEEWYSAKEKEMRSDDILRFLIKIRNEIEKRDGPRTGVSVDVSNLSTSLRELRSKFPPPPGATSFIIGDRHGGSGWLIRGSDGVESIFYVDFNHPGVTINFTVESLDGNSAKYSAGFLIDYYIEKLENLLVDFSENFLA